MERNMVWGSLGLGVLGWVCAILLAGSTSTRASEERAEAAVGGFAVSRVFVGLAVLLPFLVWALTLPVHAPFSAGQGWGRGFLLGGVGSLAGFLAIGRATGHASFRVLAVRIASTAPLFAALVVACVPLVWMRHAVIDALVGAGLGWVATTLVLLLGQSEAAGADEISEMGRSASASSLGALLLVNGAAFAAALFAVAALGVYRDFVITSVARGTFSAVAVALAGIIALVILLSALVSEGPLGGKRGGTSTRSLALGVSLPGTLVLPLGFGYLLGMKLLNDLAIIYVIGAGLVLGFLLLWLVWDEVARSADVAIEGSATATRLAYVPVWGVLVALCGFMLAYQLMQGFGVGIMLLAAWPVSLLALASTGNKETDSAAALRAWGVRYNVAHALTLLLSILAVLLVSRVFTTRFRTDLRGAGLSDQFALFGFVMGATLPALLAALWFATERAKTGRVVLAMPGSASPARLGVVGLLALALPVAMLAVWGAKVAPAFFAGLALAIAGFTPLLANRRQPLAVALFSLAISLTLAQWAHRLAPFAEMSRAQRLHLLLWALGAMVLLVLIVDYGSRIASGWRERKMGTPVAPTQGGS